MRLGLKLKIIATEKPQRQIAADTNIPENRLSEIVRGWVDPRDEEREALIRVLGCSPDVFDRNVVVEARSARRVA